MHMLSSRPSLQLGWLLMCISCVPSRAVLCAVRCALCAVRCAAVVDVSVVVAGTAEDSDVPAAVARLGVSEQLNVLASGGRAAVVAVGAGAERVTAAVGGLLACGLHHDGLENALHEGDVRGIAEWLQRATSTQTGARIIAQVTALLCVRACVREHGGRRGVKSRRSSSALLTSPALFPPPPCTAPYLPRQTKCSSRGTLGTRRMRITRPASRLPWPATRSGCPV